MPEIDLKEERRVLWYASDGLKVKIGCLGKPTQQRGIPMRYTIKTSGLMCGHCDATVETALLNVAGVTDADADHETQTVQVECADTVAAEPLVATQALLARINADVLKAHIEGCVTSAIESGDEDLKAAKLAEIERVVDKLSK